MDRNPRFGEDAMFQAHAGQVADLLWNTVGANFSEIPTWYLANLRHEYDDGRISMAELFDRVDLGPDATYEEYRETFDALLCCDRTTFPDPDSVIEVKTDRLFHREAQDFAETFDFSEDEDLSYKVESFLKKVLASAYKEGISDVSDKDGHPPNLGNNYLLSEDGSTFSGIFYDTDPSTGKSKNFPFTISQNGESWEIAY
jgi:hypothetical protein